MNLDLRIALLLFCLAASACKTRGRPPDGRGREWFAVSGAIVERGGDDTQDVDDAGAFGIEGGHDVLATEQFRAGFEFGFSWSSHDGNPTSAPAQGYDLNVMRWSMGGRASFQMPAIGAVLYANGGIYLRDEDLSGVDPVAIPPEEESGHGLYYGAGMDFWYDRIGRMGPFVRVYEVSDSDVRDVLVGFSVTFYP